jgi:hypothetical protein
MSNPSPPRIALTGNSGLSASFQWWYADPVSLLHFEDGANTFVDSASSPLTWTAGGSNGTATESTAQYKFGTASANFSGYNCFLTTPNNVGSPLDLATGQTDFTIDMWVYPTTFTWPSGSLGTICDLTAGFTTLFRLYIGNSGRLNAQFSGANGWGTLSHPTALALNTWTHVALTRSTSSGYTNPDIMTLYVNGVPQAETGNGGSTAFPALPGSGGLAYLGASYNSNVQGTGFYQGYIDEFRVAKYSIWQGAFTPPTAPSDPFPTPGFWEITRNSVPLATVTAPTQTYTDTTPVYGQIYAYTVAPSNSGGTPTGTVSSPVGFLDLQWTRKTTNSVSNAIFGAAADSNGNILIGYNNSNTGAAIVDRSTDGGNSWTNVLTIASATFNGGGIWCDGSVFIVAPTSTTTLYRSTDGGQTFSSITGGGLTNGYNIKQMVYDGAGQWWAEQGGGTNAGYHSTDGGLTWANVTTFPASPGFYMTWLGTNNLFATVGSVTGYTSSDGLTWTGQSVSQIAPIGGTNYPANALNGTGMFGCISASGSGFMTTTVASLPMGAGNELTQAGSIPLAQEGFIAGGGGAFVVASFTAFASSPDGINQWADDTGTGLDNTQTLIYVPTKNIFFSGGAQGHATVSTPVVPVPSGPGVSISPSNANVPVNGGTFNFTLVSQDGTHATPAINGVPYGNSTLGFINDSGYYVAPIGLTSLPSPNVLTLTLTLDEDHTFVATATITLTAPTQTVQAYGAFRGPKAFKPVSLVNVGTINPKIYAPGENTTVKSQS